ncbi:MAG TPA: TrmH family RNA methyltransferase [Actinomycetes bacterium]|nr:TrmH family RNA methyltransferase [Actinomycetes bacterium]
MKPVVALRRRRDRERSGTMLVEGYEELTMALRSGVRPLALYYCPALVRDQAQVELLAVAEATGAELVELGERAFAKASYRDAPDGWLALVPTVSTTLDRLSLGADPLVIVCESVEKPGNLGAILRTAEAAGVDAVIAAPARSDWGNPNVVRASKGTVFSVPVAEAGTSELVEWLHAHGMAIIATTPDSPSTFATTDLRAGVAIAVGSESQGLSAAWLEAADARVRIPMFGRVNSLNVATAAALLAYEALRQRGRLDAPDGASWPS